MVTIEVPAVECLCTVQKDVLREQAVIHLIEQSTKQSLSSNDDKGILDNVGFDLQSHRPVLCILLKSD